MEETVSILTSWSWDPTLVVSLGLAAGLYGIGWRRLRRRARVNAILPAWRAVCFALGLATLALALLSPIDVFSELFLFMHMIEHLLLVEVAAPLLLLGAPLLPLLWALPRSLRIGLGGLFVPTGRLGRAFDLLTHPLVAACLYFAVLAVWHIPRFYDAAQGRSLVHDTEHLMFLGSALLYWWPVIHPAGGRRRLSYAGAIPYMLPPLFVGNLIGALLTFADRPLYETYAHAPRLWGISALLDQQIAGLIMWVPGGLVYALPIFVLLALLLQREGDTRPRASLEELISEAQTNGE